MRPSFWKREQVKQLTSIVDDLNIPVLSYGIRTDFQGEVFEGSQYLMAWADEIKEIKTICHCGKKATMNARVSSGGKWKQRGIRSKLVGMNVMYPYAEIVFQKRKQEYL